MFAMEPRESCTLCGTRPKVSGTGVYVPYENRIAVSDGNWIALYFGVEEDGALFMSATEEHETDHYYPKFCPECGRQLLKVSD